ncbi:hypothetical protein [Staphylococcus massiliensis]|uniref:Uncharacterized protein n=1 Tax=Staphylococcus massiliensis S46 TaxID=1229783 RepID=K9ANW9_9STAP|nr:hypothetical protein [Staphylococcus massiliensis]EKU48999.1 hypothetical protein C273_04320 [Staphylococcus massiliensis S46]MCG3399442.1 hypothetical protein [Staphylococcus massiliensis]MCG3411578.1 hypothetical protein [Staphylococcus massiliensis]PNZ99475.1 hypothetical protein CD133_06205 [Staphylococcus massiliensis CCUG 55927]
MMIDKYDTFLINIKGLHSRRTRFRLNKTLKMMHLIHQPQFSLNKYQSHTVLEVQIPKQQLPYLISYLSFHNYEIFQILREKDHKGLINPDHTFKSPKRFEIGILGIQDAYIKDKAIDILNYFQHHHDLQYLINERTISVQCQTDIYVSLIQTLATQHLDINQANFLKRSLAHSKIS